jgi:hypothetical protein
MTVLEPRLLFVLETSCETVALFMSIIRDWERGCVAGDVGLFFFQQRILFEKLQNTCELKKALWCE